jgi:hypothetical protein
MSIYTEECGITFAHRHTGEIQESHYVEYWCPTMTQWVKHPACLTADGPHNHMKARTQTTTTEIIEILEDRNEFMEWLEREMHERSVYLFLEGEDAYRLKYGG